MAHFTFDDSGLNSFMEQLNKLSNSFPMSYDDLFNADFMNANTKSNSFGEFLSNGGFVVESEADLEDIPEEVMDEYVSSNTTFSSWVEMLRSAEKLHMQKLGLTEP